MTRKTYNVEQGTEEWHDVRRGILTASVVGQLIAVSAPPATSVACPECSADAGDPCVSRARKEPTPIKTTHGVRVPPPDAPKVLEPATGDTARGLTATLVAERITGWTEPTYTSDDMMRGILDEPLARDLYSEHFAPAREVGFMVLTLAGRERLGYSPDGIVGADGLIEVKSRKPKKHLATILADEVPPENMAQIQAGLLVSGRAWCDYISYCGGMPMWVKRVWPDQRWFDAIREAVEMFEATAAEMVAAYERSVEGLPMTKRNDYYSEIEV